MQPCGGQEADKGVITYSRRRVCCRRYGNQLLAGTKVGHVGHVW